MEHQTIYQDIAERTGGDIYIGVVGPVRTGKSTFIKKFMENLVIPNIDRTKSRRERAVDELPQSAAGRTIMTTEPKFIPEEAVEVALEDELSLPGADDRLCGLYCPQFHRLCGKRSAPHGDDPLVPVRDPLQYGGGDRHPEGDQ